MSISMKIMNQDEEVINHAIFLTTRGPLKELIYIKLGEDVYDILQHKLEKGIITGTEFYDLLQCDHNQEISQRLLKQLLSRQSKNKNQTSKNPLSKQGTQIIKNDLQVQTNGNSRVDHSRIFKGSFKHIQPINKEMGLKRFLPRFEGEKSLSPKGPQPKAPIKKGQYQTCPICYENFKNLEQLYEHHTKYCQ